MGKNTHIGIIKLLPNNQKQVLNNGFYASPLIIKDFIETKV